MLFNNLPGVGGRKALSGDPVATPATRALNREGRDQ